MIKPEKRLIQEAQDCTDGVKNKFISNSIRK